MFSRDFNKDKNQTEEDDFANVTSELQTVNNPIIIHKINAGNLRGEKT